jgi:hypothetical protein
MVPLRTCVLAALDRCEHTPHWSPTRVEGRGVA